MLMLTWRVGYASFLICAPSGEGFIRRRRTAPWFSAGAATGSTTACGCPPVGADINRRYSLILHFLLAQYCSALPLFLKSGARLHAGSCHLLVSRLDSYRWRTIRGQRAARSCRRESALPDGRVHPSAHRGWYHDKRGRGQRYTIRIPQGPLRGRLPQPHTTSSYLRFLPSLRCALYFTISSMFLSASIILDFSGLMQNC